MAVKALTRTIAAAARSLFCRGRIVRGPSLVSIGLAVEAAAAGGRARRWSEGGGGGGGRRRGRRRSGGGTRRRRCCLPALDDAALLLPLLLVELRRLSGSSAAATALLERAAVSIVVHGGVGIAIGKGERSKKRNNNVVEKEERRTIDERRKLSLFFLSQHSTSRSGLFPPLSHSFPFFSRHTTPCRPPLCAPRVRGQHEKRDRKREEELSSLFLSG